jgi:hypothetical protein
MSPDDPEKLKAALSQLEAERERRIEAKVAEDKAIREPLIVVLGGSEEIDAKVESARAARLAELQGAGEKREVVFEKQVIITGVPRSPKTYEMQPRAAEDKPDYGSHLKTYGPTKPIPPLPKPEPKVEAPPDPQRVRTETRQCKNDDDPGEIVEGYYDVRDGQVYVWTVENGARPLGHAPVRPGDDPAVIARRLLRDKVGRGGFWHRLH